MSSTWGGGDREVKFCIHGMDVSVHFHQAPYIIRRRWLALVSEDTAVRILNGRLKSSGLHPCHL
jgi:hypothetical protein